MPHRDTLYTPHTPSSCEVTLSQLPTNHVMSVCIYSLQTREDVLVFQVGVERGTFQSIQRTKEEISILLSRLITDRGQRQSVTGYAVGSHQNLLLQTLYLRRWCSRVDSTMPRPSPEWNWMAWESSAVGEPGRPACSADRMWVRLSRCHTTSTETSSDRARLAQERAMVLAVFSPE